MRKTVTQKQFTLTQNEQELLPSEQDIRFYEANGYYISPKIISDELLDSVLDATERYYQRLLDEGPAIPSEYLPSSGLYQGLRKHTHTVFRCNAIEKIIHLPLIAATAARLARVNEIRLWRDELMYKPTGVSNGTRVGWHRDRSYWSHCTSTKMLTAWIPFTSISHEMGAMQVLSGSNHWCFEGGNAKTFFDQDLEQQEVRLAAKGFYINPVPIVLERGQVSFHDCFLLHASSDNISDILRQCSGSIGI